MKMSILNKPRRLIVVLAVSVPVITIAQRMAIPSSNLQLCGNQDILLSEFDLNGKDILAGIIKVDDRINVRFVLNLKCL